MKFQPTAAKNFSIHIADKSAAKKGEPPGTRTGELVFSVLCVDEDGDERSLSFYVSDALSEDDAAELALLLAKVSSHAIDELTD